jgi:hypothetical protein
LSVATSPLGDANASASVAAGGSPAELDIDWSLVSGDLQEDLT